MAKSIVGFHYSLGGNKTGIGAFMDKLNQNGVPFLVKGTDDAGLCFEGQQKGQTHGVANHLIYRVSTAGQNNGVSYDVPNYTISPANAAKDHFTKTAALWPPELNKSAVWMEPINEPRAKLNPGDIQWGNMHPVDWLGFFMYEYAKLANSQGFKVCGPSFNSGEPEVFTVNTYELPGMLAYLQYCADNPSKAALSIHEYTWDGWQQGQGWPNWYPNLWGRVEAAIAAADKHNIPRAFSIFVTEWGFAYQNAPRWPECEPYLTDYNGWAARFPQVKGAAAWTLANGWGDVDSDLQSWFGPLGDYAVNTIFNEGPQPAATHAAFGGTLPDDTEEPMPDNLLQNASFEDGWENQNGGHRPKLWRLDWKLDGGYVLGESQIKPQNQIPEEERPLFFVPPDETSWYMLKVFKNNAPIRPKLYTAPEQFPNLPAGKYRYSFYIYPDVYKSATGNQKVWSDNPNDGRIRLYWNGVQGNWQSLHPYGGDAPRLITFEWEHTGGPAQIGFQCDMPNAANANNGSMTDAHDLRLVEEQPMTWQEQVKQTGKEKRVLAYKKGSSLQVVPSQDGFQVSTNEYDITRPDGSVVRCREAVHPVTAERRWYYAVVPNWGNVQYLTEGGSPDTDPK